MPGKLALGAVGDLLDEDDAVVDAALAALQQVARMRAVRAGRTVGEEQRSADDARLGHRSAKQEDADECQDRFQASLDVSTVGMDAACEPARDRFPGFRPMS